MRRPDKSSPFSRIVVVYPLASAETLATLKDRLCAAAVSRVTRLHGDEAGEGFKEFLHDVLRVKTCSSLDVNAASALVEAIEPGAAVIFVEAARYRQIGLSVERADGESSARIAEDRWVHHLRAFADSCVAAARRRESYVVLDAGHLSPYRAENREVLQSVSGCGVLGSEIVDDPRDFVVSKLDEWANGVKAGLIGRAFSEIDALPESLESEKRLIKIQLLGRAMLWAEALKLLWEEVPTIAEIDPSVLVRYARFAREAGDTGLSSKFLSAAIPSLNDPEDLELAWGVSSDIDDADLEEMCLRQLDRVLPSSHRIEQHRFQKLIDERRYAEAVPLLENPILEYSSEVVRILQRFFLA